MTAFTKRSLTGPCGVDCFNCETYEKNITDKMKKQFVSKIRKNLEEVHCYRCQMKAVGVEKWDEKADLLKYDIEAVYKALKEK